MADQSGGYKDILKSNAWKFIILLGLVSLLADMTYEGARSITGQYLAILGASATVVGFVSGFGELVGYVLRFFSGYLSDKTKQYWAITMVGYAVNLLAVPLLALAGSWEIAAVLMITERFGKAIRTPARDVMLSHATSRVGSGWGFGVHEAMESDRGYTGSVNSCNGFIPPWNLQYRICTPTYTCPTGTGCSGAFPFPLSSSPQSGIEPA